MQDIRGALRIEEDFRAPYALETIPWPNPDGYQPVSIDVAIQFNAGLANYPSPLEAGPPRFYPNKGIIVDLPVVANVTKAFIILEGAAIVPEPAAPTLVLVVAVLLCFVVRAAHLDDGHASAKPSTP